MNGDAASSTDAADREFVEMVKSAVQRTVTALGRQRVGETLMGYALCTDDGLETLLHQAITQEALQASGDPDLLFMPTDWPFEPDPEAFDDADEKLRSRALCAGDLQVHVERSFSLLTLALAELRNDQFFAPGVFLKVLSTDPSEYLERLEDQAVERLNGRDVVEARRAFLNKWADAPL